MNKRWNIQKKYNKYFVILFLLNVLNVYFFSSAAAQNDPVFYHISTSEGLPNNNIKWIAPDEFGLIWIATENGIARFDGAAIDIFKAGDKNCYGPVGGNVHFMGTLPGSNSMWVGATTGLSRYDQKNGKWSRIPILYQTELQAPLPTYIYPFHIDDEGCVWLYIGYYGGICRYYPNTGELMRITQKSNGRVYTPDSLFTPLRYAVSSLSQGICYADFTFGKLEEKLFFTRESPFPIFAERCYYQDSSRFWMAADQGLVLFNPTENTHQVYGFPSPVTALAPDKMHPGFLWLGTKNDGIYRFNISVGAADMHMEHDPEDPYSIRSNHITFICVDSLGRLFAGLTGKGVAYADVNHTFFSTHIGNVESRKLGINNSITHIFPKETGYLVGTVGSGLVEFNDDQNFVRIVKGVSGEQIYSGIDLGDVYLIQSSYNYFTYNKLNKQVRVLSASKEFISLHVFGWIKMPDGKIYAGTDRGLYSVDLMPNAIDFTLLNDVNADLGYNYIQYIYSDSNDYVYIKTNYTDFSVYKYLNGKFTFKSHLDNQNYLINDMFPFGSDGRFLLAATSAGIKVWDNKTQKWIKSESNILNENIMSISYHPSVGVWASTDNGLYRYAQKENKFEHFGIENGLSSEQFSSATCILKNSMAWGSVSGITAIPLSASVTPLKVNWLVKNLFTAGIKNNDFYPSHFPDTLVIPSHASDFTMDVSVQGIPIHHGGRLTYRLSDVDDISHTIEKNGATIAYNRLSPGDYTLALSYETKWPSTGIFAKNVFIRVEPAFYQTVWFRWLIVIANILIVIGIVRFVLYRQKIIAKRRIQIIIDSQENERARIAADLHDDLGGKLSTLKLLMEETGRQNPDLKNFNLYTGSMEMLDHSISDLRTTLFNLNPRTLSESGIFSALSHLCGRIRSTGGLHIELHIPGSLKGVRFPLELETVIYRLVQELINNTIKHAEAKSITITFESKNSAQLFVIYSDDGKGFDEGLVEKGLGLQNIKTRVDLVGGKVQFQSSQGKGTKVIIFIPVNINTTPG